MKNHIYNSTLYKILFFTKRFGFLQLVMKPIRVIFAPIILKIIKPVPFLFNGKKYFLCYHPYNTTWANERAVEVPIIRDFLMKGTKKQILEIGNVTRHYFYHNHEVLDKFEIQEGIINKDIVSFKPDKKW